jgi:hypothetical protein
MRLVLSAKEEGKEEALKPHTVIIIIITIVN